MDAFKCLLFFFLFVLKTFNDVEGASTALVTENGDELNMSTFLGARITSNCILSLKKDFGTPSPVFLRKNTFLAPNDSGAVTLKKPETVTVACPGSRRKIILGNITTTSSVLEAHCIEGTTFSVEQWRGPFSDIKCNGPPYFTTQLSDKRCYRPRHERDAAKMYRVGYQVKNRFYSLYEVCFDEALLRTSYAQHTLKPSSRFMQLGGRRPDFIEGDLFGKVRMSRVYKNQKEKFNELLGANMSDIYITKKQFLTRGHLAPRADFTLGAETRASFHYINSAPQFQRGNAGDWAALEEALRRRVQSLGRSVIIRTGTHDTMWLPDHRHQPQEIYLYSDENNNLQVPVPLYFYKLVYDSRNKTATAFISINSSYYNDTTIEDLIFCYDVCEDNPKFSWLRWRPKDGTSSFCCSYEEFANKIDYLETLDVKGLFY